MVIPLCLADLSEIGLAERIFPAKEETNHVSKGMECEWRKTLSLRTNSSDLHDYQRDTPTMVSGVRAYGVFDLTSRVRASAETYAA